ncbi:hypothetical protein [Tunturiibacter gelidoferens]|uniref:Uncharacterized protein n=1 Tax=Tunturiibacter gelidiferens TaxID=3069689 RepID=A0A9X0U6U4_9BACT|nr:hypothetical protein [Edaphobacter lichenicola]MBB5331420.1 hypothetical protein [Edaphobacter lichenicola]
MLNVLLLGAIHQYQHASERDAKCFSPDQVKTLGEQRGLFGAWVRVCVSDSQPELIFDEMNLPESAVSERFMDTEVPWVYMDIPEDVRARYIPARSAGEPWLYRIDEPRERHWQLVIESITSACDLTRIIAICGAAHLESFSSKLRAAGHTVEVLSVRDMPWNDETWCPQSNTIPSASA